MTRTVSTISQCSVFRTSGTTASSTQSQLEHCGRRPRERVAADIVGLLGGELAVQQQLHQLLQLDKLLLDVALLCAVRAGRTHVSGSERVSAGCAAMRTGHRRGGQAPAHPTSGSLQCRPPDLTAARRSSTAAASPGPPARPRPCRWMARCPPARDCRFAPKIALPWSSPPPAASPCAARPSAVDRHGPVLGVQGDGRLARPDPWLHVQ
eukprot:scaffold270_cov121-Isochrysis_galbana.AAC.28